MNSVYGLVCNMSVNQLRDVKLFSSLDLARKELNKIAQERRGKLGVSIVTDSPDKFSFLLGWEDREIIFSITEIAVE